MANTTKITNFKISDIKEYYYENDLSKNNWQKTIENKKSLSLSVKEFELISNLLNNMNIDDCTEKDEYKKLQTLFYKRVENYRINSNKLGVKKPIPTKQYINGITKEQKNIIKKVEEKEKKELTITEKLKIIGDNPQEEEEEDDDEEVSDIEDDEEVSDIEDDEEENAIEDNEEVNEDEYIEEVFNNPYAYEDGMKKSIEDICTEILDKKNKITKKDIIYWADLIIPYKKFNSRLNKNDLFYKIVEELDDNNCYEYVITELQNFKNNKN